MGKKKAPTDKDNEEPEAEKEEPSAEAPEEKPDPPIVVELKALDDQYLEIERECEREMAELQRKYTAKQAPLLEQRKQLLTDASKAEGELGKLGTPALSGFWLQAMKHLPALEEHIEEWDEPVLEYISDVEKEYLDPQDIQKGFSLTFRFVENPYFTNETIWKEYHTQEASPYTGEIDTTEIKVSEINWKPGKNVTVETIKKKVKGGGAKKNKQKAKEKEEPRDSFFRNFFRNLKPDMQIPDDINLEEARQLCDDSAEEEDEEEMISLLMENDYEIGCAVRDQLIPFAVRWYTGEAQPDDYDSDDEDDADFDEEEEEDDDDDDDDDEEESPPPRKKNAAAKKRGTDDKKKGAGGGASTDEKKPEECKQQ